jgi:hypothetical protein
MSANVDAMVKEAIRAHRAGRTDEAHTLLMKAVEIDENHEQAWMWLSGVVDSVEDRIACLENVLLINPDNVNAQRGLDRLLAQQNKQNQAPFTGIDTNEWGDIDSDTTGFMSNLEIGIDAPKPPPPSTTSDYQTGYESAFDSAVLGVDYDEDFDPLGDDFDISDLHDTFTPASSDVSTDDDISDDDLYSTYNEPSDDDDLADFLDEVELEDEDELETLFGDANDNTSRYSSYDGFVDDDQDDFTAAPQLDQYFHMIPATIRPTRIPGDDDKRPAILVLLLLLLFVGNLGMIALLVVNMTA